jgi:predicted aspartyl protease
VSGDVYGKMVMLENMQIGDLTARNVPAAIIPTGLDRSLLGQAFLKQIDNVNISGDRMVLK